MIHQSMKYRSIRPIPALMISFAFVCVGMVLGRACGDEVSLKLPNTTTTSNQTASWGIEFDCSEMVGAMQFDLIYPASALDNVSIESDSLLKTANGGMESNLIEPGRLRIALACTKPLQGKGPLLKLNGTPASATTEISLTISDAVAWESQTLRELRVESNAGLLKIESQRFELDIVPWWAWAAGVGVLLLVILIFKRK